MASRALSEKELAVLSDTAIALDGIAVIVNSQNPLSNMTGAQVKGIFTGELAEWSDVR
jgi:phosphate transport system substrate-binding protein